MAINKKLTTSGKDSLIPPMLLLLICQKPAHGYELIQRLHDFDPIRELEPGTIYRNLRRLEGEGLVVSEWETSTAGPARRQYAITTDGLVTLGEMVSELVHLKGQIELILSQYKDVEGGDTGAKDL